MFSGCFHSASTDTSPLGDRISDLDFALHAEVEEFEGVLEVQNISLLNKATHVLKNYQGELLVQVKSSQVLLSEYEDKNVRLIGSLEILRDGTSLLEVEKVEAIIDESLIIKDEDDNNIVAWETFKDLESRYSFRYPEVWKVILARKVVYIREGSNDIVKITRLDNSKNKDLASFVGDGYGEITVNGQSALRIKKGDGFHLYLRGVFEIIKLSVYNDFGEDSSIADTQKEEWVFQFLNSFHVSSEIVENQKCGGDENTLCAEGFRCEIKHGNAGICKDISQSESYDEFGRGSESLDSNNEKVVVEKKEEEEMEEEVIEVLENEDQQDINLQSLPDIEGDAYINKHMSYQLTYPKHWWYRSFGSQDGDIWHTEFGKKEIENIGEGIIMVDVKHGARGLYMNEDSDIFQMILVRDSDSHFQISGPVEYLEEIKGMAKSLQMQEE
jgi:hypothetical protein